ncbi:DNA ligase D [Pedobacter puniceum]|uniref:DNA ligase (ATP) n=1 Tax=Pedobacter puniceum TaxID=2666136 RepID=A0A7K0FKM0_9SPHI|nr:DNA ligase D [Pedobacter puniceum]MRX46463.1 DNA ligase D [Pedobacter puniceum]
MSLTKYQQKRNFEQTTEPKSLQKAKRKTLSFVVQRHHASHLHYDFRLEIDGVLKSWAIPKGPSLNPKDKRLAMMVEDHPYDYKNFEGEIPKGNYGAGTVYIFDAGNYQSLSKTRKEDEKELKKGLATGSLKFKLNGKILKGEFALVKLKNSEQDAWLLIKHQDEFSVNKSFNIENLIPKEVIKAGKDFKKQKPEKKHQPKEKQKKVQEHGYSPMLTKLSNHIFNDKNWLFERKIDGYRILASTGEKITLTSRNGIDYTSKYQQISNHLKEIKVDAILDGEIVAENKDDVHQFQWLQNFDTNAKGLTLKFYVFDILKLHENELLDMPLLKRKELLKVLLEKYKAKNIVFNDYILADGEKLFEEAKKQKWEGVIAKRIDDEYYPGKRTDSWLKIKLNNSQEAIICGFTKPAGSRKYFGALVLGMYDDNQKLSYIGNCGTGFNDETLKNLHQQMEDIITTEKPFADKVNMESKVTWLKPQLICEVNYTEWTLDHHLRHPVFKGLRLDKDMEEVKEEKVLKNEETKTFGTKKVKLTNLDKLYWPKEKITKGELLNYYESIANYILPYLKDKPLSLNRHPNGITKPGFYQKDVDLEQIPKWAKTAQIHSESNNKEIDYLICNDKASLLYMANLGCIEINPWLSTYKKPENPEYMVIDLDPDKNDFKEVVQVASAVKEVYDEMNIKSFVKTSGSSGIHIFIYLAAKYDYKIVKNFAEFIAQKVHEKTSEITSLERSPSKRKNLIYIDYLQNRRGQTIAAPYSVRPKPNATVSFPLSWDEVDENLDMKDFHLKNVLALLKDREDPWRDMKNQKIDILKTLKTLK